MLCQSLPYVHNVVPCTTVYTYKREWPTSLKLPYKHKKQGHVISSYCFIPTVKKKHLKNLQLTDRGKIPCILNFLLLLTYAWKYFKWLQIMYFKNISTVISTSSWHFYKHVYLLYGIQKCDKWHPIDLPNCKENCKLQDIIFSFIMNR